MIHFSELQKSEDAMSVNRRLKYAREASGMTLKQVQEGTGLGLSSLSEWENGTRDPSFSQLSLLAKIYDRASSFFLEDGEPPIDVVLWREKPNNEVAGQVEIRLVQLAEQFQRLEQVSGNPKRFHLPLVVESRETFDYGDAERLAHEFRKSFSLGERPGCSLLSVLEEVCRVKVFHLPFEPSGTAACSLSDRFGAAILLNSNNIRWRRNFDLAHELFHLLTWRVFRVGEHTSQFAEKEESFANRFASNLLMPEEPLKLAVAAQRNERKALGYNDLFEIARQFDVSVIAVLWRMVGMKLIERVKAEEMCKAVQKRVEIWEKRKTDAPLRRPVRFEALAREAIEKGQISTGKFAEYMGISRRAAMALIESEINIVKEDGGYAQVEIVDP
jgi:Zn-dependent peptidase ImmA (M78 family)